MLEVEYKGGNSVIITTKNTKVVFDPVIPDDTINKIKTDGAVVAATEPRFMSGIKKAKVVFDSPGEYEVGDVGLLGVPAQRHIDEGGHGSTIYKVLINDLRVVILGNISPKLTEEHLEQIGVVDMVIIPVGGDGYTLDATAASSVVRQLDPKIVIPVHYADANIRYEVPQDDLSVFINEMGAPVIEAGLKWKLKGASALPDRLSIVKIDRS